MIRLVHSGFMDRMNRSTTVMLPCLPIAPNRGWMPCGLHRLLASVT